MTELIALYFHMGMYNSDDDVAEELNGFDCPFEDGLEIRTTTEEELREKIEEQKAELDMQFGYALPDLICNSQGEIMVEVYSRICNQPDFDPKTEKYSQGRETLETFWVREKHHFFNQ